MEFHASRVINAVKAKSMKILDIDASATLSVHFAKINDNVSNFEAFAGLEYIGS